MAPDETSKPKDESTERGTGTVRPRRRRWRAALIGVVLVFTSLVTLAQPASAHTGAYYDPALYCEANPYIRVTRTFAPKVWSSDGTSQWVRWLPEFWGRDEYSGQWHLRQYGRWAMAQASGSSPANVFLDPTTRENLTVQTYTAGNGTNNVYVVNRIEWYIDGAWHSAPRTFSHTGDYWACSQTGLSFW
jgi:hypothetical protein